MRAGRVNRAGGQQEGDRRERGSGVARHVDWSIQDWAH